MLMTKQAGGRRQVKKEPIHRRPIFGPPGSAGQRPPAAAFSETFVRIPCLPACLLACLPAWSVGVFAPRATWFINKPGFESNLTLASACVNGRCMYCVLELFAWTQLHLFHDRMHFESERVLFHQVMLRFGRAHTLTSLTCQAAVSVDN